MKKALLFAALLLFIFYSCSKKDNNLYYGTASAIVNGVPWQTNDVRCGYLNCRANELSMTFDKYSSEGFLRESYVFQKFKPDNILLQQLYPLTSSPCYNDTIESAYATSEDDGDVVKAFYEVINNENSYLKIESYNPSTKEISGSFTATYLIDSNYLNSGSVDTVRVTNGKFSTRILY
jgi:hypothetical protein